MKIHPKGKSTLFTFSLFLILLASLSTTAFAFGETLLYFIWIFVGILILLFSMFFRYPERQPFIDPNAIVSAADGKVVAIEKVDEKEYFMEERIVISVFMSIYDVHVNTIPADGEIIYTKNHPGKNYPAFNPKSSELNEMTSTVLRNEKCSILIRQIAGIVARRIYQRVNIGDIVKQGDELGLIKLGSRVDIFLPTDVTVNVKINDKVTAGQSVLAWID